MIMPSNFFSVITPVISLFRMRLENDGHRMKFELNGTMSIFISQVPLLYLGEKSISTKLTLKQDCFFIRMVEIVIFLSMGNRSHHSVERKRGYEMDTVKCVRYQYKRK